MECTGTLAPTVSRDLRLTFCECFDGLMIGKIDCE